MGSKEFMPGFGGYYTASLCPQLIACRGRKPPPEFSVGQKAAGFSETHPTRVIPAQAGIHWQWAGRRAALGQLQRPAGSSCVGVMTYA